MIINNITIIIIIIIIINIIVIITMTNPIIVIDYSYHAAPPAGERPRAPRRAPPAGERPRAPRRARARRGCTAPEYTTIVLRYFELRNETLEILIS